MKARVGGASCGVRAWCSARLILLLLIDRLVFVLNRGDYLAMVSRADYAQTSMIDVILGDEEQRAMATPSSLVGNVVLDDLAGASRRVSRPRLSNRGISCIRQSSDSEDSKPREKSEKLTSS